MSDLKERLKEFINYKNLSNRAFLLSCGFSESYLNNISKGISNEAIKKIKSVYPELSISWLTLGEGEMLTTESIIGQQIKLLIEYLGMTIEEFCQSISVPQPSVESLFKHGTKPSLKVLAAILSTYPDISAEWLMLGEGEMSKKQAPVLYKAPVEGAIPYYENLPVSAGQFDMVEGEEQPTGYVKIPGVFAKWLFPVIGCSMKPEINPGDIIGVNVVDRWDRVEPDKIYMIITTDERMIKRLRIDNESDEILWCISPNYPEFKIQKSDIRYIYQVVFHGEFM